MAWQEEGDQIQDTHRERGNKKVGSKERRNKEIEQRKNEREREA